MSCKITDAELDSVYFGSNVIVDDLNISNNDLTSLDICSADITSLNATNNLNLLEIGVNDVDAANANINYSKDGSASYVSCSITGSTELAIAPDWYVYRDGEQLSISISDNYQYSIIDLSGAVLMDGSTRQSVNVTSLEHGVYILNVQNSLGEVFAERIFVD